MSSNYRIHQPDKAYFVTMTVVGWIDIFSRLIQRKRIVDCLAYCQKNKGLIIYAYCIMPSHLHMICQADEEHKLSGILRDFKTFSSKQIIQTIKDEPESRRAWLLELLKDNRPYLKQNQKWKVWQDGNHAKVVYSIPFIRQKLNYIHMNPVKDLIVDKPEDYVFSSARNYANMKGLLDVVLFDGCS
ncbi:MAG: transposase [Flavobacteriales bacterium]|nr:transposase [Flavobacteriales bacterium]MCB9447894.1 transposase [Flavobacteriales bacterium]